MRPVDKSIFKDNQVTYDPYGNAKDDLISALGSYCSYCERYGFSTSLDVEHVEDKSSHPQKETQWDNFLLACKNCNSIKGAKEVNLSNILMPHLNDTFKYLEYKESGLVGIASSCVAENTVKVQSLIDLIGLDRRPGHPRYSIKDKRWEERKKTWEIAKRYRTKYIAQTADIEMIQDLAKASGFWSIWMHAFSDCPEVQRELILAFPGTNQSCFHHILNRSGH